MKATPIGAGAQPASAAAIEATAPDAVARFMRIGNPAAPRAQLPPGFSAAWTFP